MLSTRPAYADALQLFKMAPLTQKVAVNHVKLTYGGTVGLTTTLPPHRQVAA